LRAQQSGVRHAKGYGREARVWSDEDRNPMGVGSTRKRQANPQVL